MQKCIAVILLFIIAPVLSTKARPFNSPDRVVVTVTRNYSPLPKDNDKVIIRVDWKELLKRLPQLKSVAPVVVDGNFGGAMKSTLIDTNGDKAADYLNFEYTFQSTEPVFSFLISPGTEKLGAVQTVKGQPDSKLKITFLQPFRQYSKEHPVKEISSLIVESTMKMYPNVKDFPIYAPNRWNYEYSFFLLGSYKLGKKKNNQAFIDYPKRWVDSFIKEEGGFNAGIYEMNEYKLDDIIPARLAILFDQQTGEKKYKSIVDTMIDQLSKQPKTSDGGYWHKEIYPNQMWLDGIFMADVFSMQYANAYNKPEWYDEAVHQIKLIYKHTKDPATGLLYHGWDESKNPVWADPETGTSPEFWGRAVGWYAMALIDCLDFLPKDHPDRETLIKIFKEVCTSVKVYQHATNHLWYQVLDKADQKGNWPEASCSAMFAYAFAKGYNQQYLDASFLKASQQAFDALLDQFVYIDGQNNLHLDQTVKVGTLNTKTSKGDYQYYISTERRINDYKGLASLLYTAIELNR